MQGPVAAKFASTIRAWSVRGCVWRLTPYPYMCGGRSCCGLALQFLSALCRFVILIPSSGGNLLTEIGQRLFETRALDLCALTIYNYVEPRRYDLWPAPKSQRSEISQRQGLEGPSAERAIGFSFQLAIIRHQ